MEEHIQKIKRFNRFYLNVVGLYSQYTDGSPYSLAEAMILFEISNSDKCTASKLSEYFNFDKGYVSRILNKLREQGLINRISSDNDKRKKYLHITGEGKVVLEQLSKNASENVRRMIEEIDTNEVNVLIKSMEQIESILSKADSKVNKKLLETIGEGGD